MATSLNLSWEAASSSSTSPLATVGKPGWFGAGKNCTGGEGSWRFGAVSKGDGDGGVSCMTGDLLGLVGGSGSRLAGLSAIIETAVKSLLTVEPASIIIGLVWISSYCCWSRTLKINPLRAH